MIPLLEGLSRQGPSFRGLLYQGFKRPVITSSRKIVISTRQIPLEDDLHVEIQKVTHPLTQWCIRNNMVTISSENDIVYIDPAWDVSQSIKNYKNQTPTIILTHSHGDHYNNAFKLATKLTNCKIYLPKQDFSLCTSLERKLMSPFPKTPFPLGHHYQIESHHLGGHTPGSVGLSIKDKRTGSVLSILTGDTLFRRSCGITPSTTDDHIMRQNILGVFNTLSPDQNPSIFPGHGGITTREEVERLNPIFSKSSDEWHQSREKKFPPYRRRLSFVFQRALNVMFRERVWLIRYWFSKILL